MKKIIALAGVALLLLSFISLIPTGAQAYNDHSIRYNAGDRDSDVTGKDKDTQRDFDRYAFASPPAEGDKPEPYVIGKDDPRWPSQGRK